MEDNTTPEKLFVDEFASEFADGFVEKLEEPTANDVFIVSTHPFPFKLGGQILVHTYYVFRAVQFETLSRPAPVLAESA